MFAPSPLGSPSTDTSNPFGGSSSTADTAPEHRRSSHGIGGLFLVPFGCHAFNIRDGSVAVSHTPRTPFGVPVDRGYGTRAPAEQPRNWRILGSLSAAIPSMFKMAAVVVSHTMRRTFPALGLAAPGAGDGVSQVGLSGSLCSLRRIFGEGAVGFGTRFPVGTRREAPSDGAV